MLVRTSFFYVAACSSIGLIGSAMAQIQAPHRIRGGDVLMQKDSALPHRFEGDVLMQKDSALPHRFLSKGGSDKVNVCNTEVDDDFKDQELPENAVGGKKYLGTCAEVCPKVCDDNISCTDDSCVTGCIDSKERATTCEGETPFCSFELDKCVECRTASDCGTDDTCTEFTCDAGVCGKIDKCSGCSKNGDCDDGIYCTIDTCNDGICENKPEKNLCDVNEVCAPGQGGCFLPPGRGGK
ncbi:hypothetical protein IV203_022500 [Nitzschia inconspicua]|uniref:Uncharacterized protein n=1 Tax=Nitzschia inconspicua TaxID=303405 RepID=A0A9K3KIS6_9STRA|nr:hypothetical protein IV203_022500 [Nitzschia inconspicua]